MDIEYSEYLKSSEWQKKRNERLKMDEFKCQMCGRPFDLDVHHITYRNIYNENVATDLITVCRKCHERLENEKERYKVKAQYDTGYKVFMDTRDTMIRNFINEYKCMDCAFGGKENFCNIETIKKYWGMMYGSDDICVGDRHVTYVQVVQEYFREAKKELIHQWKEKGAEKEDLRRIGISENMITKYWDK